MSFVGRQPEVRLSNMGRNSGSRVLLVEDNRSISRLVDAILSNAGFELSAVPSGRSAVDAIRRNQPDLVLLDLDLPDLDGFRVIESIRKDDVAGDARVVAFTSHAEPGVREEVTAAGFDGYISKPIVPDDFVAAVERFISD